MVPKVDCIRTEDFIIKKSMHKDTVFLTDSQEFVKNCLPLLFHFTFSFMIAHPENEKLVEYLVVLDKPGRKFHSEEDNRWGGLIEPAPGENPAKTEEGLRVVLFSSWEL